MGPCHVYNKDGGNKIRKCLSVGPYAVIHILMFPIIRKDTSGVPPIPGASGRQEGRQEGDDVSLVRIRMNRFINLSLYVIEGEGRMAR